MAASAGHAAQHSSKLVIYAALAGNLLIAITKFVAAGWTGSSAMLSEGVHSLVDTGNQGLMLYGLHRAKQPPDEAHPLGHGRELYFWSFIVALLIFSLGAGISFYEGIVHILNPVSITEPMVNYVVLGLAFVFEGGSWLIAWREFKKQRGEVGVFTAVVRSRDPTGFIVLFEDSAALVGIVIAFVGMFLAERLEMPILDGAASLGIGAVLALTAIGLARECKGLLIGESAREDTRRSIREIAAREPGVQSAGRLISVHLGPNQIVVALEIDLTANLDGNDAETVIRSLRKNIRERHADITEVFITPSGA